MRLLSVAIFVVTWWIVGLARAVLREQPLLDSCESPHRAGLRW